MGMDVRRAAYKVQSTGCSIVRFVPCTRYFALRGAESVGFYDHIYHNDTCDIDGGSDGGWSGHISRVRGGDGHRSLPVSTSPRRSEPTPPPRHRRAGRSDISL